MRIDRGKLLSIAFSLVASIGLHAAPAGERVIDPHGRYCFRIDSTWADDGYDVNSDTVTIRHAATEARLTHNDSCWLMAHTSEVRVREIEMSVLGLGRRTSFVALDGRYGPAGLALYESVGPETAAGSRSPFFGCADVESGWLIVRGSVSPTDVPELHRILQEVRVDCARFEGSAPRD